MVRNGYPVRRKERGNDQKVAIVFKPKSLPHPIYIQPMRLLVFKLSDFHVGQCVPIFRENEARSILRIRVKAIHEERQIVRTARIDAPFANPQCRYYTACSEAKKYHATEPPSSESRIYPVTKEGTRKPSSQSNRG